MTDTGKCPAFGYDCEYVAKVEAQAAEIERLRAALKMILDIDEQDGVNGYFLAQHYANAALGDGK